MAIDKKTLQQLISRPEAFRPEDMEEEDIQAELAQKVEGSDQDPEAMGIEDMAGEEEDQLEAPAAPVGTDKYQPSPEVMQLMKQLKGPSPQEAEVQAEDISGDMQAPMELRKKAIEQIRKKYLGQ